MDKYRASLNRRLWSLVRLLPGGKETMREMVALLHKENGTYSEATNANSNTSTRSLSDEQLLQLIQLIDCRVNPPVRRRSEEGNIIFLTTAKEIKYAQFLARELGWSEKALNKFIRRQIKSDQIRTYKDAKAIIHPLERMLCDRGYGFIFNQGRKWLIPPKENAHEKNSD